MGGALSMTTTEQALLAAVQRLEREVGDTRDQQRDDMQALERRVVERCNGLEAKLEARDATLHGLALDVRVVTSEVQGLRADVAKLEQAVGGDGNGRQGLGERVRTLERTMADEVARIWRKLTQKGDAAVERARATSRIVEVVLPSVVTSVTTLLLAAMGYWFWLRVETVAGRPDWKPPTAAERSRVPLEPPAPPTP
jgi:chromosome segregation ATPase